MSLKDLITEDMKSAMRAKESARLGTIRLLLAAIKQKEVDERIVLDDAQVTAVIDKMLKQRRDSINQFESAGRQDLVDAEKAELEILTAYMPQQLGADEVRAVIAEVIAAVGAIGPADMGKVMGPLKAKLAGKTDMAAASALVKAALGGAGD
ncbi:GatB/YqeY domain-containing protein [Methyloversatilis sp.]|uniref:GatB/YqeY domain-containing protein n=1 Tax=Methyloversatilis sp. TaxID=2569862 RepID=UPI00273380F1|nr:GatB/YqeY domain-containing protein [Methyloversatilis sp.]MDP2870686.1 GatB/YqeY domain-containing protein [Methyloversatilis sp.]MDP3289991.1 GatB/YqeY domain-containing protein [Methyloversatilis sp.]MDP3455365.1 GatB/YqeY domain-containing protein [Methyloversatilis sp.]MDP3577085.1 GatB/YqeY domain-containing protein [Methyloversatilis sp.]